MGELGSQFGHLVYLIDALTGQIIQFIKVMGIARHLQAVFRFINGKNRLEQIATSFLYVLPHGVQICREVNAGGEYTLILLSLAFPVKLFPPFGNIMQFRVEVHRDLDHVPLLVERIPNGSVCGGKLCPIFLAIRPHIHGTFN